MALCIAVIANRRELRELLCDVLTDEDHAVAVYAAAEPALVDVPRIKPDLIVLDWHFGREEDGIQVLQQVRLHAASTDLPVLVCSLATRQVVELEPFLQARNVRVVYKPFIVEDVLAAINRCAEGASAAAERPACYSAST